MRFDLLDELIALNEKFHKARHDYDVLMESSMSRYHRPAPAPSTNPFGQAAPYQSPLQTGPQQQQLGYIPPATSSPPPTNKYAGGGSPVASYPPAQKWDAYQPQAKPWENATQAYQPPQTQVNPWEAEPSQQAWGQQPASHPVGAWDPQYQPPNDAPPSTHGPATYSALPPQQQLPQHYGGGLDELANSPLDQSQEAWYDASRPSEQAPPGPPPQQANAYHPPPAQATKPPYPSRQSSHPPIQPDQQAYPPYGSPPPPSQAPPAIPFDQKPTPYPTGQGKAYSKQPATYEQPNRDPYASLRELSPDPAAGTQGTWYSAPQQGAQEEQNKGGENGSAGGGYYGVPT